MQTHIATGEFMTNKETDRDKVEPDIDQKTGQPIEEAEDNLSRHSTRDSSKPVEEIDKDIEPTEK
jgi:hypothetical protein